VTNSLFAEAFATPAKTSVKLSDRIEAKEAAVTAVARFSIDHSTPSSILVTSVVARPIVAPIGFADGATRSP
jgi:hypothetical protein